MRKGQLLLATLAGVTLISCAEPTGPASRSVAPRGTDEAVTSDRGNVKNILKNLDVQGTLAEGGTFSGRLTIAQFAYDETTRQLLVSGVVNGFVTDESGRRRHVRQVFTDATATLSRESGVASLDAGPGLVRSVSQTCDILFLDLGPIELDLLGLTLDLSQVVLDLNAVGGAGNLLGNLLCFLTSLLDITALPALILQILEQINQLLQNLNNLFPLAA